MVIKINKSKYALQGEEWIQLRSKVKDVLLNKRNIGVIVNEIMYLLQDEIAKTKKEIMK